MTNPLDGTYALYLACGDKILAGSPAPPPDAVLYCHFRHGATHAITKEEWHKRFREDNPETDEEVWAAIGRCEIMLAECAALLGQIKQSRAPELTPGIPGTPLSNRPAQRIPGYNVNRVGVGAGMDQAYKFGYTSPEHQTVTEYALMRHARGEEDGAQATALGGGISLTAWYAILAAAITTAEQEARS
jgi:hypothetical protein